MAVTTIESGSDEVVDSWWVAASATNVAVVIIMATFAISFVAAFDEVREGDNNGQLEVALLM